VEQKGTTKRRPEPKPFIMAEPKMKVAPLAQVQERGDLEEAADTAKAMTQTTADKEAAERAARASAVSTAEEVCDYVITVVTGDAKGASTQVRTPSTTSCSCARHDIHLIVYRCSPRHPPHNLPVLATIQPHNVPVLATSFTSQCTGARRVIHHTVYQC